MNFNIFKMPTATKVIQTKLEEYERNFVLQREAASYHAKMAEHYKEGIRRMKDVPWATDVK